MKPLLTILAVVLLFVACQANETTKIGNPNLGESEDVTTVRNPPSPDTLTGSKFNVTFNAASMIANIYSMAPEYPSAIVEFKINETAPLKRLSLAGISANRHPQRTSSKSIRI